MFCKKCKRRNSYFNNVSFPPLACHSSEKAAELWLQPLKKKKILKKKILCHFLFLRSLPDLSCDRFSVTRLPTLRHLVHPVPGARLFGVVVASDSLTSAGPVASLLSAQPVFDREHEEWVFFISLGRLTQRPVLTLSNLHEAFCSSQNKP